MSIFLRDGVTNTLVGINRRLKSMVSIDDDGLKDRLNALKMVILIENTRSVQDSRKSLKMQIFKRYWIKNPVKQLLTNITENN